MIHLFLILKRTGQNVYKKSFGTIDMNEDLMSGFFSAFFIFAQTSFGFDFQDIRIADYRIIFETLEDNLIIAALFDEKDSIINIKLKLKEIIDMLIADYSDAVKKNVFEKEDFRGMDEKVVEIITSSVDIEISIDDIGKVSEILKKLSSSNEVIDCGLISYSGIPLIQGKEKEFMNIIIKQMDAFWELKKSSLHQIILYFENIYIILLNINDQLVFCATFKRNTPIGMSSYLIEDAADKINQITHEAY